MKKFTFTVLVLLVSFCFILAGCSSAPLTMPTNYDVVVSNGGFVLGAGNYLYFGNAYKSYEDLTEKADNDGAKVQQYALKRVELDNKTSLKLNDEEEANYENVANKIAGYETSNMYVVGEYLYFTSPNVHKNDSKEQEDYNTYEFNLNTLFRIKLDGTGLKELYTTETETAKFCLTGGNKQSILIYDDEKIMQVKCYENSTKVITLAEDVKSTVFPYEDGVEFVDVYFTAERDEDDQLSGDLVKKLNIVTGEISNITNMSVNKETITLISYNGSRLFFTRTGGSSERVGLFSNDFSSGSSERKQRNNTSSFTSSSKIFMIKSEEYDKDVFVFEYNSNIYVQEISADNDADCEKITNEESSIAFVDGTYVYYTTENGIFRVSILGSHKVTQISDITDFNADLLDFDGKYVYFYAKIKNASSSSQYLFRADVDTAEAGQITTKYIAELLEDDVKAIEEAEKSAE